MLVIKIGTFVQVANLLLQVISCSKNVYTKKSNIYTC